MKGKFKGTGGVILVLDGKTLQATVDGQDMPPLVVELTEHPEVGQPLRFIHQGQQMQSMVIEKILKLED
jgi:hypothetical protein